MNKLCKTNSGNYPIIKPNNEFTRERYTHSVNPNMAVLIDEIHSAIGGENIQETIRNLIRVGASVFKERGKDEFLQIAKTCKTKFV